MSDAMTFAEAMALDPGEVEVTFKDGPTMLLANAGPRDAYEFWRANYRRARPKRSRVQEMAEEECGVDQSARSAVRVKHAAIHMEHAIRAVCEWLRSEADKWTSHEYSSAVTRERLETVVGTANLIEREFLVPK